MCLRSIRHSLNRTRHLRANSCVPSVKSVEMSSPSSQASSDQIEVGTPISPTALNGSDGSSNPIVSPKTPLAPRILRRKRRCRPASRSPSSSRSRNGSPIPGVQPSEAACVSSGAQGSGGCLENPVRTFTDAKRARNSPPQIDRKLGFEFDDVAQESGPPKPLLRPTKDSVCSSTNTFAPEKSGNVENGEPAQGL